MSCEIWSKKLSLFHYICLYELWDLRLWVVARLIFTQVVPLRPGSHLKKKKKNPLARDVYKLIKVSDPKRHVNQKRPKHAPTHTPCNLLCGLVLPFDSRADLAISYAILPFTQINQQEHIYPKRERNKNKKNKNTIRKQTKRQSKGLHHPCNFNPIFLHTTKL